jgi:hypothetical protein
VLASENLAAGDYVDVYDNGGTANVRKADATTDGKLCTGFVKAAFTSGNNATVYFDGINDQVTSQTVGPVYLQTTPGLGGATVPSTNGNVVQPIGWAVSATEVVFSPGESILIQNPA